VLQKSIRIKEEFVKDDVHEHGNRAALNFGHTFGHALESYFLNDKEPLLHGECVALGMIIETWLGHLHLGVPPRATCRGITGMINKQVPVDVPRKVRMQELLPVLRQDKKQRGGSIRFTFIRKIGDPVVDQEVDEEVFDALLEDNEITLLLPWLMK
jgi:3-dehydroquinate synthase